MREQHLFSHQKRRLKEDFIAAFSYKMRETREEGARLFSEVHTDSMGGDRHVLP